MFQRPYFFILAGNFFKLFMDIGKTYFYTASILGWKPLLQPDHYKDVIIQSLQCLVTNQFLKVYSFVIMPDHIHVIWELLQMNGKEMPHASFMKYTGHRFLKKLKAENEILLNDFRVNIKKHRDHQFWQRNALPIELYTEKVFFQKMNYIHRNPVCGKYKLASDPLVYKYSSARFCETGIDEFGFFTHWSEWQ